MTTVSSPMMLPVSMKTRILAMSIGAVIGAVLGLVAWTLQFSGTQAVSIISIGRTNSASGFLEEPQSVMERMRSAEFARAVAARAGDPALASQLPSKQYGGSGALTVRNLRDLNLLEIRLSLPDAEKAKKAITAVIDEILNDHGQRIMSMITQTDSDMSTLDRFVTNVVKTNEALKKRIDSLPSENSLQNDGLALLSARASTDEALGTLVRARNDIRKFSEGIRKTVVVTEPTVIAAVPAGRYRIMAAGAIVGLLAALLLLQLMPGMFRGRALRAARSA